MVVRRSDEKCRTTPILDFFSKSSNVQADTVQVGDAPAETGQIGVSCGTHEQTLQSEADTHPGIGNTPGPIERVGAHGTGPSSNPSASETTSTVAP